MKKVLFYCQHVLGMGHFIRSMEIIRGLKDFAVRFCNGGENIPGFMLPPSVTVVNLPPLKSNADFTDIQVMDNLQNLAEIKEIRTRRLLDEFEQFKPDLVIIELFPFGRKKFAFELVPLLTRIRLARGKTKVVCSLRDILVSKRDQARHEARVCALMNRYFDLLLIHADPRLQRLEETFSGVADLQTEMHYTGYVVQAPDSDPPVGEEEDILQATAGDVPLILVSIGGGRVGYELLTSVVEASIILAETQPHRIPMFTGPYLPEEQFHQLQEIVAQRPHILLRRYTPCFLTYMARADLSISMAGYNTCMNILTTGVRALVLPFTGGHNTEQTIRAEKLEALGALGVIRPLELQPALLAQKIQKALQTNPVPLLVDLHGVENTVALLTDLLAKREVTTQSSPRTFPVHHNPSSVFRKLEAELRPHLERFQAEGKTLTLFLRDDDVDEDEETLRHFLDISLSRHVPMNLAIIPGRLTDAAIQLLKDHKRFHPTLVELHQHGWQHLNHEPEGKKYEFGPSRSLHQQFEDIARGKALLEEIFGEKFSPVFTPPWNRCTEETFKVLDQLGFQGLSKEQGMQPVTGYHFQEISITLDLYRWKGGATMKLPAEIVQQLLAQIEKGGTIGLLLHHKVMAAQDFAFLDHLLAELRRFPMVRFCTMPDLLQPRKEE